MADKFAIRAYGLERRRNLDAAASAMKSIAESSARLARQLVDGRADMSEIRHVAALAAEACARATAFEAVEQLSFLAADDKQEG